MTSSKELPTLHLRCQAQMLAQHHIGLEVPVVLRVLATSCFCRRLLPFLQEDEKSGTKIYQQFRTLFYPGNAHMCSHCSRAPPTAPVLAPNPWGTFALTALSQGQRSDFIQDI